MMRSRVVSDWVIHERPSLGAKPYNLAVLLHGFTGNEKSMNLFVSSLPVDTWLVVPRGIYRSEFGGFSWYKEQGRSQPWVDDFRPAIEALFDLLLPDYFPGAQLERFDLLGFSQGAALAFALAFLYPQRVRNLAGLAGFLPQGCEALARNKPLLGKRIFVAHGVLDELVPIERGRYSVDILKEAGGKVVFCEDKVGHKMSKKCISELKTFFAIDSVSLID